MLFPLPGNPSPHIPIAWLTLSRHFRPLTTYQSLTLGYILICLLPVLPLERQFHEARTGPVYRFIFMSSTMLSVCWVLNKCVFNGLIEKGTQ